MRCMRFCRRELMLLPLLLLLLVVAAVEDAPLVPAQSQVQEGLHGVEDGHRCVRVKATKMLT